MKRIFDLTVTLLAMPVALPLMALVALLVRIRYGRPVLFKQMRPGYRGRPFRLIKFRTMTNARDSSGNLLSDGARLTRFGRALRASSLDELPELFNVLKGEMSLVGPRPLLMQYLPLYSPEQARRHDVLPGITGWAQVHGRNALTWEQKFAHDIWYVDNRSLWLDLRILGMTMLSMFRRHGVSAPGHDTMPPFERSGRDV